MPPKSKSFNIRSDSSFGRYNEVYSQLAGQRIIFLSEDITGATGSELSALLLHYNNESKTEEIVIYINCNGGDASALSNIYDVMQIISAPISTICIGKAYSAAAVILCAGTKGRRFMTKNADVMIHGIQAQFPSWEGCDTTDSGLDIKLLEIHNKSVMESIARHTGQSYDKVYQDCTRDLFLDSKQSLEYGIIDVIL